MLRSVAILHRHGARGPGDSELKPWHEDDTVHTQWLEGEEENLSSYGVEQMKVLGAWVAERYCDPSTKRKIRAYYRCSSKSDRALESGRDFVSSFNTKLGVKAMPDDPIDYEISADYYFRPWKIHKEAEKLVKKKQDGPEALSLAEKHKDFLLETCLQVKAKEDYAKKLQKFLWSSTHIIGLIECESFWPCATSGPRNALILRTNPDMLKKVASLASWVWEERSGCQAQMGGWLFLDMIQRCFDPNYSVNEFSAHDYTILAVLSSIGALSSLEGVVGFGSYVIMELYEGPPPPISSKQFVVPFSVQPAGVAKKVKPIEGFSAAEYIVAGATLAAAAVFIIQFPTAFGSEETTVGVVAGGAIAATAALLLKIRGFFSAPDSNPQRFLRLKWNQRAFEPEIDPYSSAPPPGKAPPLVVHEEREVVLADFDMHTLNAVVDDLCKRLIDVGLGLPPNFAKPSFH